jgi:hypothetical protein
MSCVRRGLVASEPVSQRHIAWELFITVSGMSFIYTVSSSKDHSLHQRATDLGNVCFFKAALPENCGPTLSVFVGLCSYTDSWYVDTVMLFILRVHASFLEFIRAMTSNSLKWNRSSFMRRWSVLWTWLQREQFRTISRQHSLWWNYTAETLCDGIILHNRFVKEHNWNVQNIEKNV